MFALVLNMKYLHFRGNTVGICLNKQSMHRDVLLIFSFQIINNCKRIRNINSTLKLWYSTTQVLGFIIFAAAKLLQPLICLMVILWGCKITLKITYNGFIWIFEQSSEYSLFLQTALRWQQSWARSTLELATWQVSPVLSQQIHLLMWGKPGDILFEHLFKNSFQQHKSSDFLSGGIENHFYWRTTIIFW